jgi:phosphonate transport system substrate-binding protein
MLLAVMALPLLLAACVSDENQETFYFSGIPDQDTARWAQRYQTVADYLSEELDVPVEGILSVDYAAVVVGFQHGDIQMAWFGGLTGVQARLAVPGSQAIAQRLEDERFHSVFIVHGDSPVATLEDLDGLTFTFGSESSTSGHLMPRYFLLEAGVDPEDDLNGLPNFSGSHDTTWKLVETGAYQAGVLNEEVWDRAVREGEVKLDNVRELYRTPPYYDYNWTVRGDLDDTFGDGFTEKVKEALLSMDDPEILGLFTTDRFIETRNENYETIESVARQVGIIQ